MRQNRFIGVIVLGMCAAAAAYAGTDPSAFLNAGVGARALGMGGAFVSVSDDPTAMYWNPAGLGKINRISVTAMGQSMASTDWETLKDIAPGYQFIGITFPLNTFTFPGLNNESNTFGVGMISTSLDDIPYTSVDANGVITRDTFEDSEKAYYISYGFPVMRREDNLFVGATLKYITQEFTKVPGASASGYDLDAGLIYGLGNFCAGVVVQRGVQLSWANGHKDSGPLVTKFGVSNLFPLGREYALLGSADLVQRQGQPATVNAGTELRYEREVFGPVGISGVYLRAGIDGYAVEDRFGYRDYMNNNINYTVGAGTEVTLLGYAMSLDYVFGSYRLGAKNRFSLNLYF